MNTLRPQQHYRISLSVAFCVTALAWSVCVSEAASLQRRLITDKLTHEPDTISRPTFALANHQAENIITTPRVRNAQLFRHDIPSATYVEPLPKAWHLVEQGSIPHFLILTGNRLSSKPSKSYALMPLVLNQHVKRNLDYFTNDIHDRFQKYLDRFARYKDLVQRVFREVGLPLELGYLSLIESGFDPRAFSRARASGPWQFMKATGNQYGLTVTWYVDERRDPVKSTVAAAQHLKDLFDEFKSWPLALGAYNAGSGKIRRAIRKSGSRDFWKIRETRYIRRETKDYVPSFIAAALIASNPSKYGFKANPAIPYGYDKVLFNKRAHLKAVAKTTGISIQNLKELNPELLRNIVPILEDGYSLKVPKGKGILVMQRHDQIEPWTKLPPMSATWYRVRYGDRLEDVAKRFGLSVLELKRLNNLTEDIIRWNDRLRLRNDDDSSPVPLESESSPPVNWYRVRYGDTLKSVAKEFGLSATELKRLNSLTEDKIRWNDRLRVRADDDSPPIASKSEPAPPTTWYRVRYGDTLEDVAEEFDLSVGELKRLNNLTEDIIRWNDRLRVKADVDSPPIAINSEPAPSAAWYRVHFGDTLATVAQQFGLSVEDLKRLNNLTEDKIRWNDRLRVRADDDSPPLTPDPEKEKP